MRTSLIGQAMSKRRVAIAFALFIAGNVSGQDLVSSSAAPQPAGALAEVERVIVTGSNIPSAEETGTNPVDTYRAEDIQKLGELSRFRYTKAYPPGTLEIDLPAERLVSGFCASISSR